MFAVAIPGYRTLALEHLVLDYNGTLACDGELVQGVSRRLSRLARDLRIHVITADTFGKARSALTRMPCQLEVLPAEGQDQAKLVYVQRLGCERVVAIGNGRNDRLMLEAAALGIAVVQREGAAAEALRAADIVCHSILDALDLLVHPLRLTATLRS
ncbi:MAG: HAD hydrolase family protein [Betaproteobacteria bacterium]|nr:HAD hydrolase family protein [Betaproteobacteria bacterium]